MRTLIYSDVHGNLPAFESMLQNVGVCERYICLGDLVNYGPWSNECVDLAMSLPNSILLMGNHEEAFIQGFYPGSNELVKAFFSVTFPYFKRKKEISSFIAQTSVDSFTCRHSILNNYIYPDTAVTIDRNYIIGHSHYQFEYNNNGYTLYNAGSVGQNRKHINVCNYLIHTEGLGFALGKLIYSIDIFIQELEKKKYLKQCIEYYRNKERV